MRPILTATTRNATPRGDLFADDLSRLYGALCGDGYAVKPLRDAGGVLEKKPATKRTPAAVAELINDGWALVSPLASEYVALDLDGAAVERVTNALDLLARRGGGVRAYAALSGSRCSQHRVYVFRTRRGAAAFRREAVTYAPAGTRIEDRTADQSTTAARRGRGLRLPLSASLKPGGGAVYPIDGDGLLISVSDALEGVIAARRAVGLSDAPGAATTACESLEHTRAATVEARMYAPALTAVLEEYAPHEQAVLTRRELPGRRSEAALEAMRVIARRCGTDWSRARDAVMSVPACAKFARRGEAPARQWFEREAGRYLDHCEGRVVVAREADRERCERVLEVGYGVLRASDSVGGVEAVHRAYLCLEAITTIMRDGRGTHSRRVAVRDLVTAGAVPSVSAARNALERLRACGLLVLERDYSLAAPLEARRWSLPSEDALETLLDQFRDGARYGTGVHTPYLPAVPDLSLSDLPATPRCGLRALSSVPSSSRSELAESLGVSLRSAQSVVARLMGMGLVESAGGGRVRVVAGLLSLVRGVCAGLRARRAAVAVERRVWARSVEDLGTRVGWAVRNARRRAVERSRRSRSVGECLEAVAASAGARVGWPVGAEASLFGLEAVEPVGRAVV